MTRDSGQERKKLLDMGGGVRLWYASSIFLIKEKKMAAVHQRGLWVKFFLLLAVLSASLVIGSPIAWAQSLFVTSTADSGAGSLRAAIGAANADPDANPIIFDTTALSCPITIFVGSTTLGSQLPALTGVGDTIDGSACGVTLDGSSAASGAVGLRVRASKITVRGLTVQNFPDDGIRVEPPLNASNATVTGVVVSKNLIQNNLDGLRISGQTGPVNTGGNKVGATIANNALVGNRDDGIVVFGSTGSTGGHTVEVIISNNSVRGSRGVVTGGTITGDGIRVMGGTGDGSNNTVIATISHNDVRDNIDDGIGVVGAGLNGTASDNFVHAEVVHNRVRNSGGAASTRGVGIGVRGGNVEGSTTTGSSNEITFVIAHNQSENSKDLGISVAGGLGSSHALTGSISDNDVERSGVNGIRLTGGGGTGNILHDIQLLENEVRRSGEDGILVTGGPGGGAALSDILIKGNESDRNGRHGIGVFRGTGAGNSVSVAGITDNETNQNAQDGVSVGSGVPGSGATSVSSNKANNNGQDGIDLNSTGYVVLANTANNNAGAGIDAAGNIDGGGNNASGNASCNTPGCF